MKTTTVKVMRFDRVIVEIAAAEMPQLISVFHLVPASDGIWLPECDLVQYESGSRKPRKV